MSEEERIIFDHMDQLHQFLSLTPPPTVSYNKNSLERVTVCIDANKYSAFVLLKVIRALQHRGFTERNINNLAACAFNVHFGVQNISEDLHKDIQERRGSFGWIVPPRLPAGEKWPIEEVLKTFGLLNTENVEEQEITLEELETTCSTAYFVLIKITKHKNRKASVEEYARRFAATETKLVNQSLFIWLVNTIIGIDDFDEWMKPGKLVASSMACAGAILLSKLEFIHSKYRDIVLIVLQRMTMDSFATYHLMSDVADADNIDLDRLIDACNTPQWKRMANLVNERHEDLNASPCWYKISPLILPHIKYDFKMSSNPVVAITCIKLLWAIRPDTGNYFANFTLPCSQEEIEEVELAFKQYMARKEHP